VARPSRGNYASPEPGLGYLLPTNPVGGHSSYCVLHDGEPQSRLGHVLGKISASPEYGLVLDNTNKGAFDVTGNNKVDVLLGAFRHTHHCSNHYDSDSFPHQAGSGT
jgi:hypothetical protein